MKIDWAGLLLFYFIAVMALIITWMLYDLAKDFVKKQKNHWGMNIIPIKKNALSFLEFTNDKYDIIFADPPYDFNRLEDIPKIVFERNLLSSNGLLILEHSSQKNFEKSANFMEQRTYSSVNFSFFHA